MRTLNYLGKMHPVLHVPCVAHSLPICMLALLAALSIACGDSYINLGSDAEQIIHLPYVDEAVVPASARVNMPFAVELKLSTAADSELLQGIFGLGEHFTPARWIGQPLEYVRSGTEGLDVHEVRLRPWVRAGDAGGPLADSYIFSVTPLTPGLLRLFIETSDSPASGGLADIFRPGLKPVYPVNPHATWLTYEIEVLPAGNQLEP